MSKQKLLKNFISADKKQAINSYGHVFIVETVVEHDDKEAGEAKIIRFEVDINMNEITAITDKGAAHIDFLNNIGQLEK